MPLTFASLSPIQKELEERIRTASLCMCALGVLGALLYYLRSALIPLVLALALKYLLQPIVTALSTSAPLCPIVGARGSKLREACDVVARFKVPRALAVMLSLLVAFAVLGLLGLIIANSIHLFSRRADVYADRLEYLLGKLLGWIEWMTCDWTAAGCNYNATNVTNGTDPASEAGSELAALLSKVPLADLVVSLTEDLLEMVTNVFFVILFTVYLFGAGEQRRTEADASISAYIKGKVFLSAIVGVVTCLVLAAVGLDLWLVFGTLAFWLNFVPSVGAVIAVFLPMPLVVFDPDMSVLEMVLAFVLPFTCHMVVGNVVEPLLFGHSLELDPVVILLSLMVWGMLWGLTGMVLAVPITAVLKIHLSQLDHPVAAYLVRVLEGGGGDDDGGGVRRRASLRLAAAARAAANARAAAKAATAVASRPRRRPWGARSRAP